MCKRSHAKGNEAKWAHRASFVDSHGGGNGVDNVDLKYLRGKATQVNLNIAILRQRQSV